MLLRAMDRTVSDSIFCRREVNGRDRRSRIVVDPAGAGEPQAQRRRPSRNQLVWWCGEAPGRGSS
jgi:hypothetical protein